MASKNLVIREDVYRKLSEAKREGEGFSDVIERLLERGGDLLPLWGALSHSKRLAEIEERPRDSEKVRRFPYDSP